MSHAAAKLDTPATHALSDIAATAEFAGALYFATHPAAAGRPALWRRDGAGDAPVADLPDGADGAVTGLAVFEGSADDAPCLYVATAAGQLLRSTDGTRFDAVLVAADGIAGAAVWRNRLVLAATGVDGAAGATVIAAEDPVAGMWQALSRPGFGDPENIGASAVSVFEDRLYAATLNPVRGFQLWATDTPDADTQWRMVIREAAYRYAMSPQVTAMAVHDGALYVGTAHLLDLPAGIPRPAAEILRLFGDESWDLVIGEARFSPEGLTLPAGLMGPGFDDPAMTRSSWMSSQEGRLLVGMATDPGSHGGDTEAVFWSTADGEDWDEVAPADISVRPPLSPATGGGAGG